MDIQANNVNQILNIAENKSDVIEDTDLTSKVCLDHDSPTPTISVGESSSNNDYEADIHNHQESIESYSTDKSLIKNFKINKINLKNETVAQQISNNSEDSNNQCNQIQSEINGSCPSSEKGNSENRHELKKIHEKTVNLKVNDIEHLEMEKPSNSSIINKVQTELKSSANLANCRDQNLKDLCNESNKPVAKNCNMNTASSSVNFLEQGISDEKKVVLSEKLESSIDTLKHTDNNIILHDSIIASGNEDDLNKREPIKNCTELPSQNCDIIDNRISSMLSSEFSTMCPESKVVNTIKKDTFDSRCGILINNSETCLANEKSSSSSNKFYSDFNSSEDKTFIIDNDDRKVVVTNINDDLIVTEQNRSETCMLGSNTAEEGFVKTNCERVAKISHDTHSFSNLSAGSSKSKSSLVEPDSHIRKDTDLPGDVENSDSHDSALRSNFDLPCTTQENKIDCTVVTKELGGNDEALVSTNKDILRDSSISQSSLLHNSTLLNKPIEQSFHKCESLSDDYSNHQQTLELVSTKTAVEGIKGCSFELHSEVDVDQNSRKELMVPCSYTEKEVSNYDIESSKKLENVSNGTREQEYIVNVENACISNIENNKASTVEHGDKCNSKIPTLQDPDKCNRTENIGTCSLNESYIFNSDKFKENDLMNKTKTEKCFDPKVNFNISLSESNTKSVQFDILSKNLCSMETEGRVEKEANSITDPESLGDAENLSEIKEISKSVGSTQNCIQRKENLKNESNPRQPKLNCNTKNFSDIKENLTEVSNCMKNKSFDDEQNLNELKDNAKEECHLVESENFGDPKNFTHGKENLTEESNGKLESICDTENDQLKEKMEKANHIKPESTNFNHTKENIVKESTQLEPETINIERNLIQLKENLIEKHVHVVPETVDDILNFSPESTIDESKHVESESFGSEHNFTQRKENITKEPNLLKTESLGDKQNFSEVDSLMKESSHVERESFDNTQHFSQTKESTTEDSDHLELKSLGDTKNSSHMKVNLTEDSNHDQPKSPRSTQNFRQVKENLTEDSDRLELKSLGDTKNSNHMKVNLTEESNHDQPKSPRSTQNFRQVKENSTEDSDHLELKSLGDTKNSNNIKVNLTEESNHDQPKSPRSTQNFRLVKENSTEELKSFSDAQKMIQTQVNLIEKSNNTHVELIGDTKKFSYKKENLIEESDHVQPLSFIDTQDLSQLKENLITDSNVQCESLDDTQNFQSKENSAAEFNHMIISESQHKENGFVLCNANNESTEQLLIQKEDKNNEKVLPVKCFERTQIFENNLSNSSLKKSSSCIDINDSPSRKKIRVEDILTTEDSLSELESNFEGFTSGDRPKYNSFQVYRLRYNLKECEVNLKESKIDESILLRNSKELMLDKPNFRQVKRKLEDMLYDAQIEEENVIDKLEKMRQEKKHLLKNILIHIKKFKKKHGFM